MILNVVTKPSGQTRNIKQNNALFGYSMPRFSSTRTERDAATSQFEGGCPGARLILSQTLESDDSDDKSTKWRMKTIVWDSDKQYFLLRSERFWQFNAEKKKTRGGVVVSELSYLTNCQLSDGYFIDQDAKRIILPNGNWIDGPTGKLFSVQGNPISGEDRFQKEC